MTRRHQSALGRQAALLGPGPQPTEGTPVMVGWAGLLAYPQPPKEPPYYPPKPTEGTPVMVGWAGLLAYPP
jgi:hypothetical protein